MKCKATYSAIWVNLCQVLCKLWNRNDGKPTVGLKLASNGAWMRTRRSIHESDYCQLNKLSDILLCSQFLQPCISS